jgi:hypothetical protein
MRPGCGILWQCGGANPGTDNIGVQGTKIAEIPKQIDMERELMHHLTGVIGGRFYPDILNASGCIFR